MNEDATPAPGPLSSVDRDLLDAYRAWGGQHAGEEFDHFPAARRASLRWASKLGRGDDREVALDRLRREHAAQARPDLARVHVSWWVRALRDEPESVRRAVIAGLPAGLADALVAEFQLSPDDLIPDHPPDPGAVSQALALWSSQLVGDLPERDDDPLVVVAVTALDAPTLTRLIRVTGLAKWALVDRRPNGLGTGDGERFAHFRATLTAADPVFVRVATRDVDELGGDDLPAVARAGLTTFARLLNAAEPYRARWALQHLPYPTARSLRALMGPGGRKMPMLARWESDVLGAAWKRLHAEGLIPHAKGGTP